MPIFSVASYNELPLIADAHELLDKQLGSDKPKRLDPVLKALADLFLRGDEAFKFGICIMHRHYKLKDGERMVTRETDEEGPDVITITQPSKDTCPNIVADRWMFNGQEFEHVFVEHPTSITPPSDKFFNTFREICQWFGVDILGICSSHTAQNPLQDDTVFLELFHPDETKDRTQITKVVPTSGFIPTPNFRQSAWVAVASPLISEPASDEFVTLKCLHNCQEHANRGIPADEEVSFKCETTLPSAVVSRNANQF